MDDIHARVPINRVAVWVVGVGEHFNPNKKVVINDRPYPIATRALTKCEKNSQGFVDLTGVTFGRFTVIGAAKDFNGSWVVKCLCGRYSTRKSKAIKNKNNEQDRCEHCRHLAHLKREEVWRRTGKDTDIRNF